MRFALALISSSFALAACPTTQTSTPASALTVERCTIVRMRQWGNATVRRGYSENSVLRAHHLGASRTRSRHV